jgi:hypothetical protein
MLKKQIIIIPINKVQIHESCDFVWQTVLLLIKHGNLVIFLCIFDDIENTPIVPLRSTIEKKHVPNGSYYLVTLFPKIILFFHSKRMEKLCYFLDVFLLNLFLLTLSLIKNKRPIFWYFYPRLFWVDEYIWIKKIIYYDGIDYFLERKASTYAAQKQLLTTVLNRANIVTSISHSLKKVLSSIHQRKIHVVPQGFTQPDFESKIAKGHQKKSITIGFFGGIGPRIDFDLLTQLAKNNKSWQFVLIGDIRDEVNVPSVDFKDKIKVLASLSNVRIEKNASRDILYKKATDFDIGIIPYRVDFTFNKHCYPMKLFEYFWLGLPVVSTPIEELQRFPDLVFIGKNASELEKHIKSILDKGWSLDNKRRQKELALDNSWSEKVAKISELIQKTLKK